MDIDNYQKSALRTANQYNTQFDMLRNAVYGMNGEAGEVIDILKKYEFQGHDLDEQHVLEEMGDIAWYLALGCTALGIRMSDMLQRNIDKLEKRYPHGFEVQKSVHREE